MEGIITGEAKIFEIKNAIQKCGYATYQERLL